MRATLESRIRDLDIRGVVTVEADVTLVAAARHMASRRVGAVIVVQGAHNAGLLSERDVVERIGAGVDPTTYTAGEAMTAPIEVAHEDDTMRDALARMAHLGIRHLPVIGADDHVIGMASLSELVEQLYDHVIEVNLDSVRPDGASRWFG